MRKKPRKIPQSKPKGRPKPSFSAPYKRKICPAVQTAGHRRYLEHSLKVRKPRYTPPVFWNLRSKFYSIRAQSARKKARLWRAFCVPTGRRARGACAISCRIPAKPEQAGQAHRSAPHKIPHKSPALPDFYTTARAAAARPPLLCRGEGVIAPGFSRTGGVSKGDRVPLRRRKTARRRFLRVLRFYRVLRPVLNSLAVPGSFASSNIAEPIRNL